MSALSAALAMVLVVPSARTIFAPAGSFTAVSAEVVKFTPLRVRVLFSHVLSAEPSVFAALSSASAAFASAVKSAVAAGSSASTAAGSSDRHISRESRTQSPRCKVRLCFIWFPPFFVVNACAPPLTDARHGLASHCQSGHRCRLLRRCSKPSGRQATTAKNPLYQKFTLQLKEKPFTKG